MRLKNCLLPTAYCLLTTPMQLTDVSELVRSAVMLTLMITSPVLAVAVLVGLAISIGQAVTQIQDQTVSIVPKIVLMLLTMLLILPWTLTQLVQYSTDLYAGIPNRL